MKNSRQLIAFVLPQTINVAIIDTGWGNGYVALPKEHPCFGMGYDDIHDKYSIEVNGGLTWCNEGGKLDGEPEGNEGMWVIGFDTAHYGDDRATWPTEYSVMLEANRLKEQMEAIAKEAIKKAAK